MENKLSEKLFNKKENGWDTVDSETKQQIFKFSDEYMSFLNKAKTEREFTEQAIKKSRDNGYRDIAEFETLKAGDKIYFNNRGKSVYLAVIGTESIENIRVFFEAS